MRFPDDRPGDALLRRIDGRLTRENGLGHGDRPWQILRCKNILGGASQHTRAVRMLGESLRELDAGIGGHPVQIGLRRAVERLLRLLIRRQGGVGGGR